MLLTTPSLLFASIALALSLPRSNEFNSQAKLLSDFRIPTVQESAVQARRILHIENVGTLSTVFPSAPSVSERRPGSVAGLPFGSMDYFADCEPDSGNPTILQLDIGTSFRNVRGGSNITLSMRWHPPNWRKYSAAAQPRFSLIGHLEEMTQDEVHDNQIEQCYTEYHPDAVAWLPGNRIHTSRWVRLVVEEVYWIGGFGDRAYIGWIPLHLWRNISRGDIEQCALPGEGKHWLW